MTPIEAKVVEAWKEFKSYAEKSMGYTNKQNINECVNGAGAFVDFLMVVNRRQVLLCNSDLPPIPWTPG